MKFPLPCSAVLELYDLSSFLSCPFPLASRVEIERPKYFLSMYQSEISYCLGPPPLDPETYRSRNSRPCVEAEK